MKSCLKRLFALLVWIFCLYFITKLLIVTGFGWALVILAVFSIFCSHTTCRFPVSKERKKRQSSQDEMFDLPCHTKTTTLSAFDLP
jgi:uncharacterized membrane protein